MTQSGVQHISGGIVLKDLLDPVGVVIEVRTVHSLYEIAVINAARHKVAIRGGHHVSKPEVASLSSTTWGAGETRLGWIGVGMYLEAVFGPKDRINSSLIQTVDINEDWERASALRHEAKVSQRAASRKRITGWLKRIWRHVTFQDR